MFKVIIIAEAREIGCEIEVAAIGTEGKNTLADAWEQYEKAIIEDGRFFPGTMELRVRKVKL